MKNMLFNSLGLIKLIFLMEELRFKYDGEIILWL
jgi:hypothetical protein